MDWKKDSAFILSLFLASALLTGCGGLSLPDTTPPTVSSTNPANAATGIAVNSAINATFSEAMDILTITTATFTVNNGVTGTVAYSGTTATFTPSSKLAFATTFTATITTGAKNSSGNAIAENYTWNFTTGLATNIIYVRDGDGNDLNDGTSNAPLKTIQAGINKADLLYTTASVFVAQGTYNINTDINLKEGISIYGGYSLSDWTRNISTYLTIITDVRTTDNNTVINCPSDITNITVIDGFTISGGGGNGASVGISNYGSPTIINNTINGGSGNQDSSGISNYFSVSPVIINNTINGGSGPHTQGIANYHTSSPTIINNTINGGGNGGFSCGIYNQDTSPTIKNNIIFTTNTVATYSYGIYKNGSTNLMAVQNNNIFLSGDKGKDFVGVDGNVSIDPFFISANDWHLTDSTPESVKGGGLSLSTDLRFSKNILGESIDMDGIVKTVPWSMGAYEKD